MGSNVLTRPILADKTKKERLIVFDILKGIAILMVVLNHVSWVREIKVAPFIFRTTIATAVPIFITITAYLYAKNAERLGIENWYNLDHMTHMARRLLPPGIIILIASFVYDVGVRQTPFRALLRYTLLKGPFGPGGYYFFTLIQIIAVYPVFYLLAKNYPVLGLAGMFVANLLFELIPFEIVDTNWIYPIFFFRFSLLVYLGSVLYLHYESIKKSVVPVLGILAWFYMQFLTEIGYRFTIIIRWRHGSQLFAGLFALGFISYAVQHNVFFLKENIFQPLWKSIAFIGKASYHIYLFQVFFFAYIKNFLMASFSNLYPVDFPILYTHIVDSFVSIIVCATVGILWFLLENRVNRFIDNRFQKSK